MNTEPIPSGSSEANVWQIRWAKWLRFLQMPGRETAVVTVFFLLLTLAVFGRILVGPGDQIIGDGATDLERQFIHWRLFGFGQMAAGHIPLWNPHIYGGTQYFGGFQAALLYPPNWLYLCLPLPRAINLGIALHFFLAGWFMYFWVRHRGLHVLAATLAGVLFMLSGPYFLHIFAGHLPNLCTMVWGPLILLAIDGWCARRTLPWLLLGGGALAMQILAGHPQYVFYTGIASGLYSLLKLWPDPRRWWTLAGLMAVPLIGVTLSAVQVFEGLHASAESLRSKGTTIGFAGSFSFPPENILTFLVPGFFGDIMNHPYWGRQLLWEMCPFIGLTGIVLAGYALVRVRGREVWTCVAVAAVLFVMALGRYTPFFEPLYYYAPGFNKFRGWSKFLYPIMLFVEMLAAIGFDAMLRRGVPIRALGPILLGVALVFFGVGFWADWSAHLGAATSPQPWYRWLRATYYSGESLNTLAEYMDPPFMQASAKFAARGLYVAAITTFTLAVVFFANRRWRVALYALPVVALAELLFFALPSLTTFQYVPNRRFAVADYLQKHPIGDGRLLDLDDANTGMTTGSNDIWGYDPGVTRRYAELFAVTQRMLPAEATQELRFHNIAEIYARLLRCRYAFGYLQENSHEITFHSFDPKIVAPHVMLVPQVQVIPAGDAVLKAMAPPFDPSAVVILETPPDPSPAEHPAAGKAAVTAETTDSLTIEADLPDAAILVVTDAYSDGWKVRSLLGPGENKPQTAYHVMPADHCVRAIPLAAGHHRFVLEYKPAAFVAGAWVSGVGLLIYALGVAWTFASRSRHAKVPLAVA